MAVLVTGAGQIGSELVRQLVAGGREVIVLRRGEGDVPGARTVRGDAGDPELMRGLAAEADTILHCIHAPYDAAAWRRELMWREGVVMDAAAERDIPVVFPESVYAFGHAAEDLAEDTAPQPCSPMGAVRADLLAARAAHRARTRSVVGSDLVGPRASNDASVPQLTVVRPVLARRTPWVVGDPSVPHAVTDLRDMAAAMLAAADDSDPAGDRILHAPTNPAVSLQAFADDVARRSGVPRQRLRPVPTVSLRALGLVSRTTRSLAQQAYLWSRPCVLRPGSLEAGGLAPLPWEAVVAGAVEGARRTGASA